MERDSPYKPSVEVKILRNLVPRVLSFPSPGERADGKKRTLGTRLDFYAADAAWPVKVGPLFSNWKPLYFKPNRIQISRAIGYHRATRTPRQLGYLTSFFLHSVLLLLEVEQSPGNIIFHSTRDIKGWWNEIECTCVSNDEITLRHAQMPFHHNLTALAEKIWWSLLIFYFNKNLNYHTSALGLTLFLNGKWEIYWIFPQQ